MQVQKQLLLPISAFEELLETELLNALTRQISVVATTRVMSLESVRTLSQQMKWRVVVVSMSLR